MAPRSEPFSYQYQVALSCFDAAIAVDPYFPGAWYNKALAMQCLGWGRGKGAMADVDRQDAGRRGMRLLQAIGSFDEWRRSYLPGVTNIENPSLFNDPGKILVAREIRIL